MDEETQKDAERYRWIRNNADWDTPEGIDREVDALIEEDKKLIGDGT